ncbi:hypothetical protein KIPB_009872, partial [Kipferlia bialata]
ESFDGRLDEHQCEIGVIGGPYGSTFTKLTPAEIKEYLVELE